MAKNKQLKCDTPLYPLQCLHLSLDIPPSINHMYITAGYRKTLTSRAKKYVTDTQRRCAEAVREQGWKQDRDHVWYYIDMDFYFPDLRIRDSHNCLKILMDTLEGILFKNDYFILPRIQKVRYDKDNPRVEITMHCLEDILYEE